MSERIPRHFVSPHGGWVVTLAQPGTAEEHLRLVMGALGQVSSLVVPAGRIGAHRIVKRTVLQLGIAVTVKGDVVDELEGEEFTRTLRQRAVDVQTGGKVDRDEVAGLLAEAARRLEAEEADL